MNKIIGVLMLLALTGCSNDVVRHSYLKNYKLGEVQTVYVGQPIIKVIDIYRDLDPNHLDRYDFCFYIRPSNDFNMSGTYTKKFFNNNLNVNVSRNKSYHFSDKLTINDKIYSVFDVSDNDNKTFGLLVDSNGGIYDKSIFDSNHHDSSRYDLNNSAIKPSDTKMIVSNEIAPCYEFDEYIMRGDNNIELLYGGINNVTISMTYREFTRTDLARPSFFQNLVYETSAKEIRFKNFKIAVIESTNEKLVYKILEDRLEDVTFRRDGHDIKSIKEDRGGDDFEHLKQAKLKTGK